MFFVLLFYKKVGKVFLRAFFLKKAGKDFQILKDKVRTREQPNIKRYLILESNTITKEQPERTKITNKKIKLELEI